MHYGTLISNTNITPNTMRKLNRHIDTIHFKSCTKQMNRQRNRKKSQTADTRTTYTFTDKQNTFGASHIATDTLTCCAQQLMLFFSI